MQDLHIKILNRVAELSGGSEKLASKLKVSETAIRLWMQGKARMPEEVVTKLLDMLLAADLAALINETQESQNEAKPLARVIVVDDDPGSAYSLARVLRQLGHPVETAVDGPSGLELARRFRPEVVFLDLRMPGMDGVELTKQLKAEGLAKYIIAATAYRDELEQERTTKAGFTAHLLKPVERAMLERLFSQLH